jgi:hypothetical protein
MNEFESTDVEKLNEAAARRLLDRFEQRARELDGDHAPMGLKAVQQRYYPPGGGPPPDEQAMEHLRRGIQRVVRGL